MAQSFYEVLGVKRTATTEEIEAACLHLGGKYHPDNNKGNLDAAIRFKQVEQAYEILGNPEKRAAYDQSFLSKGDVKETEKKIIPPAKNLAIQILVGIVVGWSVYAYLTKDKNQGATESNSRGAYGTYKDSFREKFFEITPIGYLDEILEIEYCRRESERVAKCIIKAKKDGSIVDGHRITGNASRYDRIRDEFIALSPAIVNTASIIAKGAGSAEATILMPEGTDYVTLGYR